MAKRKQTWERAARKRKAKRAQSRALRQNKPDSTTEPEQSKPTQTPRE